MNPDLINIDPEFRARIPALTEDERKLLEESILSIGCRDPLTVWGSTQILLDGHHRYDICSKRGLPFAVVMIDLPDRQAAVDWMDGNQLGRRNLQPDQFALLVGRHYNRVKNSHGGTGANQHTPAPGSRDLISESTAGILAKRHGVGEATVKRSAKYADSVEKLKAIDPDLEAKVIAGTAPSRRAVEKAAEIMGRDPRDAKALLDGTLTVAHWARRTHSLNKAAPVTPSVDASHPQNDSQQRDPSDPDAVVAHATTALQSVISLSEPGNRVRAETLTAFWQTLQGAQHRCEQLFPASTDGDQSTDQMAGVEAAES